MKRFATQAGLVFVLTLVLATGCESEQMVTRWSADTVAVDGKMTEWVESPLTTLRDTKMRVALRNDDETLYVLVCCADAASVRSIQMSGITVWLDASGKKKKDFGIRFRGGPSVEDLIASGLVGRDDVSQGAQSGRRTPSGAGERVSPPDGTGEQSQTQAQSRPRFVGRVELAFIDKKSAKTTVIAAEGDDGPAAKCGVAKGLCLYEFSIPLRSDDAADVVLAAKPGATLGVGLAWGGAPEGQRQSGAGGPGGSGEGMGPGGPGGGSGGGPGGGGMPPGGGSSGMPPGGGRGGGPGGGGPGGGPGGSPGGGAQAGSQFAEKQEIWLKTALASPAE